MNTRPTSRRLRDRPGLQLERTELAWERSTLGLVVAGALLLLRHVQSLTGGRVSLAAADLVLAGLMAFLGRRRGRRLRALRAGTTRPGPVPDARREVLAVSLGAVAVAVGTVLLIAVQT